jgi:hypothetical protein
VSTLPTVREHSRITDSPPTSTAYRLAYFAFVLLIVVLEFPGAAELTRSPDPGIHTKNLVIQLVRPDGPNRETDLSPGDEIYSVAGERIRNRYHYLSLLAANQAFEPLNYEVLRDGSRLSVQVEFGPIPNRQLIQHLELLILALGFLLVGTWVYMRRPDLLGSLFAVNCAFLAFLLTHRPSVSAPSLQLTNELVYDAVMLL